MILSYIYNILKFKKWELLFLLTILIAIKWSAIFTFRPNMIRLTELHKCPACFGISACNYIHEVDITPHDFYSTFAYFFGVKNVFFGSFKENKIVLKKLAQNFELNEFDRILCEDKNLFSICTTKEKENDQILPAEEDWPVPSYFGACGRIIIEEYIGSPLIAYYSEPWLHRAKIASSLLDAAYKFTHKNQDYGFYLTDVSADNIAVDLNDNAKFVDLENIIVVDKNIKSTEKSYNWNELQVNTEDFACSECLAFSPDEICNHRISDHNYYAICKIILALNVNNSIMPGGLLHNIPTDILETYPNVTHLIEQCVDPRPPFNRINAGMQLKELLDIIVQKQIYKINK